MSARRRASQFQKLLFQDQAASNAGFDFRRYAIKPMPAKPRIIMAHVDGSGTLDAMGPVQVPGLPDSIPCPVLLSLTNWNAKSNDGPGRMPLVDSIVPPEGSPSPLNTESSHALMCAEPSVENSNFEALAVRFVICCTPSKKSNAVAVTVTSERLSPRAEDKVIEPVTRSFVE
jgi:hypothetical protein